MKIDAFCGKETVKEMERDEDREKQVKVETVEKLDGRQFKQKFRQQKQQTEIDTVEKLDRGQQTETQTV